MNHLPGNRCIEKFNQVLALGNAVTYLRTYSPNTLVFTGDGIEAITGYSAAEITPLVWRNLIVLMEQTGDFAHFTMEETQRRFRKGEIDHWQADIQIRSKAGEKRWLSDMAIATRNEQGECDGCIGIIQDITKRKRAERNTAALAKKLQQRNEEMENDLITASEVQQAFVTEQPYCFPLNAGQGERGLDFHHRYIPATMLAGDFYEILPRSDHEVCIFICDVVGHGIRAALLTTFLRGLLEELLPHTESPGVLLSRMNRSFRGVFGHTENFLYATAFCLMIDLQKNHIRFANAGHPDPMRLNAETGRVAPLSSGLERPDPALGIIEDFGYSTLCHEPADRDTILLYTDGLIEASDDHDNMFSEERLISILEKLFHKAPEQLLDETIDAIYRFAGRDELEDDACLLAIVPTAHPAGAPAQRES